MGPFEVVQVNSEQNLTIRDNTGKNHKVHYNNVKPFQRNHNHYYRTSSDPKSWPTKEQQSTGYSTSANRPEQAQISRREQPAPATRPLQIQAQQPKQGNRRALRGQLNPSSHLNQPARRKPGRPCLRVTIPNSNKQLTRKVVKQKAPEERVAQDSYNLRPKTNTLISYQDGLNQTDTISLDCDPSDL